MKNKGIAILLFLLASPVHAVEWWGKEVSSLKYIMPTEGFFRESHEGYDKIYIGLKGFGVDQIIFKNHQLVREKSFRFGELADPSVGFRSLLLYRDFLIVGGIQDGFLALDLKSGYPSETSKKYELIYKPDEKTIVYSSLLKVIPWKDYLLLLTADQLIIAEMGSTLDFRSRAVVPLAPQKENWRDYWVTQMTLSNDDLYILIAHRQDPVLCHIRLNELFASLEPHYIELPKNNYYLKSLSVFQNRLYVSQNKTVLFFDMNQHGIPQLSDLKNYPYYIETISGIDDPSNPALGISYWQGGFVYFHLSNLGKEESILFPPKTFTQLEIENDLLFGSAGEEGFVVYQKYPNRVP